MSAPKFPPITRLTDIDGQLIRLRGRRLMLLSLFREATCPFCNYRVYELTRDHREWARRGVDIVAVFHSPEQDVRRFIARRPRPFRMVADPEGISHRLFNTEVSWLGKLRAMARRMPAMLRGMLLIGRHGMFTSNQIPADFLIDEEGRIIESYFGRDAGDHMPLERIQAHLPVARTHLSDSRKFRLTSGGELRDSA